MTKVLVGNDGAYTFDASAKTVTLTDLPTLTIEQVLLITNIKNGSNEVIYQFDLATKGGTISGNVITLDYDTTSMADTDPLMIYVDILGGLMARDAANDLQELKIDDAGRLLTSPEPPAAGPGETDVSRSLAGDLNGTDDDEYTIPSGETLQIRSLVGGVENTGAGCEFTIFEDPNGDKTVLNVVPGGRIVLDGATQQNNIAVDYVGDGTRRIVLRTEHLTGGSYRTTATWSGVLS